MSSVEKARKNRAAQDFTRAEGNAVMEDPRYQRYNGAIMPEELMYYGCPDELYYNIVKLKDVAGLIISSKKFTPEDLGAGEQLTKFRVGPLPHFEKELDELKRYGLKALGWYWAGHGWFNAFALVFVADPKTEPAGRPDKRLRKS